MTSYALHNSQARTLGGIGAILVLLSFVPSVGALFGLVGFVMILFAVNYISQDLKDKSIFNNMMYAVILGILGLAVGSIVIIPTVVSAFQKGYFGGANFAPSASVTISQWIAFGTVIAIGLFTAWIFLLVSAVFLRRSYSTIGQKLNVGTFGTAGLLYLIGAATTIIGIGFLILFVSEIMTIVAFWSIPAEGVQQVQAPPSYQPRI